MRQDTPLQRRTAQNARLPRDSRAARRRGTALCEFAICFPVLLILVFGSIEVTNQIFAKQALVTASYECCRVTASTGSKDKGLQRAQEVLAARNLQDVVIQFAPSDISSLAVGQPFTVSATVSSSQFSIVPQAFRYTNAVATEVSMVKERDE